MLGVYNFNYRNTKKVKKKSVLNPITRIMGALQYLIACVCALKCGNTHNTPLKMSAILLVIFNIRYQVNVIKHIFLGKLRQIHK